MYEYQVGGSLSVDDPTYVERPADGVLHSALLNRQFCYVLTSRQMGKSSLRLRMRYRLEAAGQGQCAAVDMTRLGSDHITQEQWYQGLMFDLVRKLGSRRRFDVSAWWHELGELPPIQKFAHFIETVLLGEEVGQPLFIFLDEVDSLRELRFSIDDFFGFVRFCYNERAENAAYRRLTWALFGAATPRDLVTKDYQTPFNIGQAIHLSRFSLSDAAPLTTGLTAIAQQPEALLTEVLNWTGGQPFLTQKVCCLLRSTFANRLISAGSEAATVSHLVHSRLIHNWEAQDDPEHLRTIRDRLTANTQRSGRLLSLYQQVRTHGGLKADGSQEQADLKLSGVAIEQEGLLRITNPIYASVFDNDWIHDCLSRQRPYAETLNAWVASNFQDESRLLMGQALKEALQWAGDKSLSDLDYRFLSASQEWDAKMVRMELEAQEKANQMLAEAQHKATRIIWLGYLSLGLCLLISAIALLISLLR
ncbi:AAA-like domain-containing protein [Oscillatoria sp. CS-180]|uniref:AAA-like domain-containing protein n=1 Tax=Oscillatoria sp. CS-180 TaxID=3021720 RepID=UPI00232EDF07|nr:AAA-like domain-containing protein [Oscillatoria sp. CS-180]MDB9525792.1 AAA-like domain-containing protein [Oscillatoria sp. CS-180]